MKIYSQIWFLIAITYSMPSHQFMKAENLGSYATENECIEKGWGNTRIFTNTDEIKRICTNKELKLSLNCIPKEPFLNICEKLQKEGYLIHCLNGKAQ